MNTGALPTPVPIAINDRLLFALKAKHDAFDRVIVHKSPHVRVTDPVFEPVRGEILGNCVIPNQRMSLENDDYDFGIDEFFILDVHCECPGGGAHHCRVETEDLETVFSVN